MDDILIYLNDGKKCGINVMGFPLNICLLLAGQIDKKWMEKIKWKGFSFAIYYQVFKDKYIEIYICMLYNPYQLSCKMDSINGIWLFWDDKL